MYKVCVAKEHLQRITGGDYSTTHPCMIVYDDIMQQMVQDKVSTILERFGVQNK